MGKIASVGTAFIRWGHVIRGSLYVVMGLLAVQWALGNTSKVPSLTEAINLAGQNPFGKVLLFLIVLGLIGYSGWGFIRMTWERHLFIRIGYLFSALGYASLVLPAIALLMHGRLVADAGWGWILTGVSGLAGRIVLILIGAGIAMGGLMQVKSTKHSTWFVKIGIWARAILMMLAGLFLFTSGWYADSSKPHSFAQVLIAVNKWIFGPIILVIIGAGLVVLGINSLILAKKNEHTG